MKDDEKKDNIRKLFSESKPSQERKGNVINLAAKGRGNILAGGNINGNIHINSPTIIRQEFTPGPEHITPSQAKSIQDIVINLVMKEEARGLTKKQGFAKWYGALKNRYKVNSYKAIPNHLGEAAIKWLKQQSAIKRTKIRRGNNEQWRKELYSGIWARSKELGLSKGEVYGIVLNKLQKGVSSLTQLGERDIKKLYSIIMGLGKG